MGKLLDCANIFNDLLKKKYILYLEDGSMVELTFSKDNFKHLLGLHKLVDITQIASNSSTKILKQISKNIITDKTLKSSTAYNEIEERLLYFHLLPTLLSSKIIVDFDPTKTPIPSGSKLRKAEYILYNKIDNIKVAHLFLGKDRANNLYYPLTFFVEHSNTYLTEQNYLDVIKVEIVDYTK